MTNYVWTARDRTGQKVVKEIQAETAEQAKSILLAGGYSDLELKRDEIMAIVQAGFKGKPTSKEWVKHLDDPTVTFWDALRKGIAQTKVECLLLVLLAGYAGYRGHWTSAALTTAALIGWLAFMLCVSLPSIYYRKLIKAVE